MLFIASSQFNFFLGGGGEKARLPFVCLFTSEILVSETEWWFDLQNPFMAWLSSQHCITISRISQEELVLENGFSVLDLTVSWILVVAPQLWNTLTLVMN